MPSADVGKLLAALATGDEQAYDELVQTFGPPLWRAARTMVGHRADADDVVQEVFVGLVRVQSQLSQVENLQAYLFAAVRRAAIRQVQKCQRERQNLERLASHVPTTCDHHPATQESDLGQRLRAAAAELPWEQREVLALKLDGELSFREIGQLLDISQNTAASRYRYAVERLRRLLSETEQ